MNNIIENSLNDSEQDVIDGLITQLEDALKEKLAALSQEDRVRYGSINEQNKLLVNKVRDYHETSPSMSTPDVDWTEFEVDYQARYFYETRSNRLASLVYQMQSTKILHDYDNYQDALKDYAYAQYKKGANEPGFAEKVEELKQFFNRTGKTILPDDPNAPNNNG